MGWWAFSWIFLDLLEAVVKMLVDGQVLEHGVPGPPIGADGLGWTVDR